MTDTARILALAEECFLTSVWYQTLGAYLYQQWYERAFPKPQIPPPQEDDYVEGDFSDDELETPQPTE